MDDRICPACGEGQLAEWQAREMGCWVRACSACSCREYKLGEGQRLTRCPEQAEEALRDVPGAVWEERGR